MYLKEIKLIGFKSFADKTSITLDNNITCIVGPNGSGKSNIVDAVRWVLGEQSVKQLRGANNMSDVIFAGSKSRNSLSLASVTLTFDNSDSYINTPYSEISVCRKVYKNGENEYYLNNEKCRLKDISDLFLDSGMGKYAFNIISQGEIGKIISDSPYERKVIFEEAAGVLKYKKRKEDALKKLDKSNENLVRVKDIIAETNKDIEPLKIQSEKATAYISKKDKLKNIEIALIVNDLEKYNILFKESSKNIKSFQDELVKCNTDCSNIDVLIESANNKFNLINESISNLNTIYIDLVKEEEKLNGEKNVINERIKYSTDNSKVFERVNLLREKSLDFANKINLVKLELEECNKSISKNSDNILENNKVLSKVKNDIKVINTIISQKKSELQDIIYKRKYLSDYVENAVSVAVKRVISDLKLNGICGTISSLVDTSEEFALALDVAMLGCKDYVVVNTSEDAKNSINYLKQNNLGRVTFFPLDVIKPRYVDTDIMYSLNNEMGFLGVLSEKIKYENLYKNIMLNQFGNVLVVDNIENANRISKRIQNRYKIITLTGEVINVGGSITGGVLKTRSVIKERYELKNLEIKESITKNEITESESKLEKLNLDYEKYSNKLFEFNRIEKDLEFERSNKNEIYADVDKKYNDINLELSNLEGIENNSINNELDKINNKYYETLNKKDEINISIKQQEKEREDILIKLDDLRASYKSLNTSIRNIEQKLKIEEINNKELGMKMDNFLNYLSENYSIGYEKAKENYILDLDENIAKKLVNELKSDLKDMGDVNLGAPDEYKRVSERYEFLIKQSDDLTSGIATLLKIIDELDFVMKDEFIKTFKEIEIEFNRVFKDLFKGGSASLKLTDKDNILDTGIDIVVTPPGKKISAITLLSGGEKTLTAISLLFAILNVKRVPFCLFDEVEAALDEANVDMVGAYLKKYVNKTQLIIITHKKRTMEYANSLYGITMQESGVSKLVSVKLIENS